MRARRFGYSPGGHLMSKRVVEQHSPIAADHPTRRRLLAAGGMIGAGALTLPLLGQSAFAAGKLVALVHTQAAGDNGPIDDMIAHLKALGKQDHFPIRTIYASDPSTY